MRPRSQRAEMPRLSTCERRVPRLKCASRTLDAREVDAYVAKLDPRRELVYRLAIRGLVDRCGIDRRFRVQRFKNETGAIMADADQLRSSRRTGPLLNTEKAVDSIFVVSRLRSSAHVFGEVYRTRNILRAEANGGL